MLALDKLHLQKYIRKSNAILAASDFKILFKETDEQKIQMYIDKLKIVIMQ